MELENVITILDVIEKEITERLSKKIKKDINEVLTKITDDDMVDLKSALTNLALICDWNVNNIKKHLFYTGLLKFENGKYIPDEINTRYDKNNRILIKRNIIKDLYTTNIFVELSENCVLDDMVKDAKENKEQLLLEMYNLSNPNAQRNDEKFDTIRKVVSLDKINQINKWRKK